MKVTKAMLHQDLQATYRVAASIPSILRHRWLVQLLNFLGRVFRRRKQFPGLVCEEHSFPGRGGDHGVRVLIYRPEGATAALPALLYFHGGGYILGNPEQAREIMVEFVRTRPCVVIAPDYRKAFTDPFPAGFDDCYETLLWARSNAEPLNILPEKFILAGHSAGGGLAAAVALKARDTGDADIAFQMPIYPMIDDRQPTDSARAIEAPVWDTRMNKIGWDAYLCGIRANGGDVPAYAAAARCLDYANIAPTITFVGTLEPFHSETSAYVQALRDAAVDVVFREYEGCYHGFDIIGGSAGVSKDARQFTYRSFAAFYDKYVAVESAQA